MAKASKKKEEKKVEKKKLPQSLLKG